MEAASKPRSAKEDACKGKRKHATCLFLGMLAVGTGCSAGICPAEGRHAAESRSSRRHAPRSVAAKPAPQPEVGKVILVLQTRDHRVTVRSSAGEELRYSVATLHGIALADGLSAVDLKSRFPELHDIVTGIAWAGSARSKYRVPISRLFRERSFEARSPCTRC